MKLSRELKEFSRKLGHDFRRPELLRQALTHPSAARDPLASNQRLEFLGDRVLGLVIAEALYRRDKEASEGQLAPRFNALVRKETCADVARETGVGEVLRLGRSERLTGGRRKTALLGDAMEALIAAVYLDAGFEKARELVLRLWAPHLENAPADLRDAKTRLQEWSQARGKGLPIYRDLGRTGPDHAPTFRVEAALASGEQAVAEAASKRAAQQAAAAALLERLKGEDEKERSGAGQPEETHPRSGPDRGGA